MAIDELLFILTFVTTLGCAVMAGVFFPFSTFTMQALVRLPPAQGIAAMQAINLAVASGYRLLNPWFALAFVGTGVACVLEACVSLLNWQEPAAAYQLAASSLFLIGNVLVTLVFNVPLNQALAVVEAESTDGANLWTRYIANWTAWNHIRVITALAAATLLAIAVSY